MEDDAEAVLRRGLKLVPYGIAVATRAIPDSPAARVLEEVAASEQADLIVIGSSDFGPLSRVLIGSVGERLLRGSPCAVAVAPAGFSNRPARSLKQIGVCWDGSREAREARDLAVQLARASGGELRLYTAIQSVPFAQPPYPEVYVPDEKPIREAAEHSLSEACRAIPDDIVASGQVVSGDAAHELAAQAERDGIDLLLLGSRGYRAGPPGAARRGLERADPDRTLSRPGGAEKLRRRGRAGERDLGTRHRLIGHTPTGMLAPAS